MRSLWHLVAITALALTAASASAAPKGAKTPVSGSADLYPRIINCYAAGVWKGTPEAELRNIARYDLLCGGMGEDATAELARLRQLNPNVRLLPYVILRETDDKDATVKEEWWARDTHGKRFSFWPTTSVVNLLLPEVQDWLVKRCAALLSDPTRFDGIFLDGYDQSIGYLNHDSPNDIDLDRDGKRDDPQTRDAQWRAAEESVIHRIGALRGGKVLLMANTWSFPEWVPKGLLHGVLAEDQIGQIRKGAITLDRFVEDYLKTEADSRKPATIGVVNGGSELDIRQYLALTKEEKDAEQRKVRADTQRMRFGLCATLMGDGCYGYDLGPIRGQHWWYPEYSKIGRPTGPAVHLAPNVWARAFVDSQKRRTLVLANGSKQSVSVRELTNAAKGLGWTAATGARVAPLDGVLLKGGS
ncbi:MAG TPA: putative glycoside hydrolase [Armatimonadota bacterium]|jgi:hypothetical protein